LPESRSRLEQTRRVFVPLTSRAFFYLFPISAKSLITDENFLA
jgi:hypothetical protein